MSGLKDLFGRQTVVIALLSLFVGLGSAAAVQDFFTVEIDEGGQVIDGDGTGFEWGSWYYYPNTDWWNQWFYNGYDPDGTKTVRVYLTIRVLDPQVGTGSNITVALNWTSEEWPLDQDAPPLPATVWTPSLEDRYIKRQVIVPETDIRTSTSLNTTYEITGFCPEWVSIDVRGANVSVEGRIEHECSTGEPPEPPLSDADFGDAPEGALAYPSLGVNGLFPTCVGVGPASWIEHDSKWLYFGPSVDLESDGNGGTCPLFNPNNYNKDEKVNDRDAGLLLPRSFTITGDLGAERIWPLTSVIDWELAQSCEMAIWGRNIDIEVHNERPDGREGYVNILVDWNRDGIWQGEVRCGDVNVPEHAVVNFPVPAGYHGPLSALNPPDFMAGPLPDLSYVWTRFTITERPIVPVGDKEPWWWNGDGVFEDGETEDYLLQVRYTPGVCYWREGEFHKMHWPQVSDSFEKGLAVDMFWGPLADDFRCTEDGPITDIHFWGGFMDDVRPGPTNSLKFAVSIYANQPADQFVGWSRPGELLWKRTIQPYSYNFHLQSNGIRQDWFDPASKAYEPENHERIYQFDICFDEDDPNLFIQREGTIYWIEIKEVPPKDVEPTYTFGWKSTKQELHFGGNAAWFHPVLEWMPITFPVGHENANRPLDLAFVITGGGAVPTEDFGDAPDPTYATLLASDGARHTIVPGVHLGARVDGEIDGQPNPSAAGDDLAGSDDEDGVVFPATLTPGNLATFEVTASVKGILNAWIDWNGDGDWEDADEHVFLNESLNPGVNPLVLTVPGKAAAGKTFARFRFSTFRWLDYVGLAPDGEVEDYQISITDVVVPSKPPVPHLKWSQPPIETAPGSGTPVYCGWDEAAYTYKPFWFSTPTWKLVADDFRCAGEMPVTSVHWWGSYTGWDGVEAPDVAPDSWRIGFWSNVPADSRYPFSRPGQLLWLVDVDGARVEEEIDGIDQFPQMPSDTCFQYNVTFEQQEYFWQREFADSDTEDEVFWISITAYYSGYSEPRYPWGWKTRPQPWMDGAVTAEFQRSSLNAGFSLDPATAQPITNSLVCERLDMYDMAFELDTDPAYIKWEQAFTGLRHWAHYEDEQSLAVGGGGVPTPGAKWLQAPDTSSTGVDVDVTVDLPPTWPEQICADDFQCTTTGPITGITVWGSWYHDILPSGSAENVMFTLSIREDIPADRSGTGYSMPGEVLWRRDFERGQFTVEPIEGEAESYYSPANQAFERNNHLMIYKYTFDIDSSAAFVQTGSEKDPTVYWLVVQAQIVHAPGSVATRFGWKTSLDHWNDDAVWVEADEPYGGSAWQELTYPKGHSLSPQSMDLAFAIETTEKSGTGTGTGTGTTFHRVVADDWRCTGDMPVTGLVWWGSYIGYGYLPCECQQMPAPKKPDYFLLSIWTDVPNVGSKNSSLPGEKIWEYRADEFDEVMVGFDKHPEPGDQDMAGFEPVYRYTVRLPEEDWFCQEKGNNVYWLSVVAVYEDGKSVVYPWGWTNHESVSWQGDPGQEFDALGHWKFDETSGLVAADSSGNGNDGDLLGNPLWRPFDGWYGGAIDLDGDGDYVKVAKPVGFNFAPNSFAVSVWINSRNPRGQYRALLEYDRFGLNTNRFGLWLDSFARFHFRLGWDTVTASPTLNANQWYHLVASFDSVTGEIKLYIDGSLEMTAKHGFGFAAPYVSNLTIGARGSEDAEYYDGLLDDVRVFGFALSEEDVLALAGGSVSSGGSTNNDAVAADFTTPSNKDWPWQELYDQTGASEDMSFMLLTDPDGCPDGKASGVSISSGQVKEDVVEAKSKEKI